MAAAVLVLEKQEGGSSTDSSSSAAVTGSDCGGKTQDDVGTGATQDHRDASQEAGNGDQDVGLGAVSARVEKHDTASVVGKKKNDNGLDLCRVQHDYVRPFDICFPTNGTLPGGLSAYSVPATEVAQATEIFFRHGFVILRGVLNLSASTTCT